MEIRQVTDDYAVSGQIAVDDIRAIKEAGYRSIICNRPDDEQPGHPTAADIAVAAKPPTSSSATFRSSADR